MEAGREDLGDDAFVVRRVWVSQCPEGASGRPPELAFRPSSSDDDGLSVWVETSDAVTRFGDDPQKQYFVARMRVGDVRKRGMTFERSGEPGHYVIPDVNRRAYADKQKKSNVRALMEALTFCCELVGPFP